MGAVAECDRIAFIVVEFVHFDPARLSFDLSPDILP